MYHLFYHLSSIMPVRQIYSFPRVCIVCAISSAYLICTMFAPKSPNTCFMHLPRSWQNVLVLFFNTLGRHILTTSRRRITRHIGGSNTHVMRRGSVTKTNLCRLPQIGTSHRPQITQKQPNTQGNQIVFFGNMRVNVSRWSAVNGPVCKKDAKDAQWCNDGETCQTHGCWLAK